MPKNRRFYFETMDEEIRVVKRKGYIEIDTQYIQMYEAWLEVSASLNGACALKLFPFLCFESNDSNGFLWNDQVIARFNDKMGKEYNKRTVQKALQELVDKGIVRRVARGSYWIHPKYTWSASITDRKTVLEEESRALEIEEAEIVKELPSAEEE